MGTHDTVSANRYDVGLAEVIDTVNLRVAPVAKPHAPSRPATQDLNSAAVTKSEHFIEVKTAPKPRVISLTFALLVIGRAGHCAAPRERTASATDTKSAADRFISHSGIKKIHPFPPVIGCWRADASAATVWPDWLPKATCLSCDSFHLARAGQVGEGVSPAHHAGAESN